MTVHPSRAVYMPFAPERSYRGWKRAAEILGVVTVVLFGVAVGIGGLS